LAIGLWRWRPEPLINRFYLITSLFYLLLVLFKEDFKMKKALRIVPIGYALVLALVCALTFAATNAARAQSQPEAKPSVKQITSGSIATPSKAKTDLPYRSSFEHYKPYSDEKTASWRAANDEVGRIGGWRAYLKEANEADPAQPLDAKSTDDKPPSSAPSSRPPSAAPANQPVPSSASPHSANPHAGHGSKR
jgi:hypothetical protein